MHSTTILLIEVGALLFALGMLGRIGRRVGLSPIPLYLLAGLAFGHGGLLPLSASEEFIEVGAEIGVILLLVMLGLEYSASELVGNLRASAPAGLLDMLLNALPGAGFAFLLGWGWEAAIVLAGITWVSSSGVIAKMLHDLGRLTNRETPVILSVIVIEDLAMAFYLPILTALLVRMDLGVGTVSVLVALAAVFVILFVALRHGAVVSRLVWSRNAEVLMLSVLGLTILVAGVAAQVNASAAVGAFLVGIAISGPVAERAGRLLSPLRDLFAAVFFLFFGLSTDPKELVSMLLPAALLAVVTMGTKVLTGYLVARRAGIGEPGRWRAGFALTPRGEFSIVIAGVAVASGIPASLAALATGYVLITIIVGPILARVPDTRRFSRWTRRIQADRQARAAA